MRKQRIKFDLLVHDLKVPLAVIEAGITSLIQRPEKYGPLSDKQLKVLKRALRNTVLTRSLVNDALELSRSSEGIINRSTFQLSSLVEQVLVEVFDLNDHAIAESIRDCVRLSDLKRVLSEKNILLYINDPLWKCNLCMDESKVKQIVRNLLNNALKYKKERVELKMEAQGQAFTVTVKDDGDGIPADYHRRIFECYFQMDMQENHCVRGHGLGLAGVMVLVEDMGGQLYLESDRGKGATFSVRLPI